MDEEIDSLLLLLVSALGQVATASITGSSIHSHFGLPSGFRGGSLEERPGQNEFFEARRKWAGMVKRPLLPYVQACLLFATYLNTFADLEGHRLAIIDASSLCVALLQNSKLDQAFSACEPLRYAYWMCVLNTGHCHLDCELLGVELRSLRDKIPPPTIRNLGTSVASGRDYNLLSSSIFTEAINLEMLTEKIRVAIQKGEYCNPHCSSTLLIAPRPAIDRSDKYPEPTLARDYDL